jgi:hypothetical protein
MTSTTPSIDYRATAAAIAAAAISHLHPDTFAAAGCGLEDVAALAAGRDARITVDAFAAAGGGCSGVTPAQRDAVATVAFAHDCFDVLDRWDGMLYANEYLSMHLGYAADAGLSPAELAGLVRFTGTPANDVFAAVWADPDTELDIDAALEAAGR